jgi:hypothetical protein
VADFVGDGILDVLITQGFDHPDNSAILLGNGDGTFGPPIVMNAYFPEGAVVADMNGDGRPDLVFQWAGDFGNGLGAYGVGVLLNSTVPAAGTKFSPASVTFPEKLGAQTCAEGLKYRRSALLHPSRTQ